MQLEDDKKNLGLQKDGSFRFHIPATFSKSRDGKTIIRGIASVQSPDIAGETVIQNGMDLSYFLQRGFFNDNHVKTSSAKVGVPTTAKHTPKGLYVEGYLLDTQRAQEITELAEALRKSGNDRQLGFSVEGKILQRDGKIINKSWIKDIAITAEPVHPDTYMEIVKSLSARIVDEGYINDPEDKNSNSWNVLKKNLPETTVTALQALKKSLPDIADVEKSLDAGHETGPGKTGGGTLRKESLEVDLKNEDIPQPEEKDKEEKDKEGKRYLTKSQAIEIVTQRGYSQPAAEKICRLLFDKNFVQFLNSTQPIEK